MPLCRLTMERTMPDPQPGRLVILTRAPSSLFVGLPKEDQSAIKAIVGHPVTFVGYNEYGEAELEFTDDDGDDHTIWVAADLIRPA
jgi:precorrin isomerase